MRFARRRRRVVPLLLAATVIVGGTGGAWLLLEDPGDDRDEALVRPVKACDVPLAILERMARGYVPRRSGDVIAVEQEPNQFGTRHSSPYPYAQEVPLVLYGPGYIARGVTSNRVVTVADLAPTFADLLGFSDFRAGLDGNRLVEGLLPADERNGVPRLIVVVVWDGGGDNVLAEWPGSTPNLDALSAEGTSFTEATVGSTPSITPSVHATLGTGVFPDKHGLPDTRIRVKGKMVDSWERTSPRYLRVKTLADAWDRSQGNAPLVGMLARDAWHLGMIGHGAFLDGADHDFAVMDDFGGTEFRTNDAYYALPEYMQGTEGLAEAVDEVDARDGALDGQWLGNAILEFDPQVRYTPAWSIYQTQRIVQLLANEGFGADEIPDLFYTNYKSTDLAGHLWNMTEPEVRDDLVEQDRQLRVLVDELDRMVGPRNYVLALTADHGMTPYPHVTGGWSIEIRDMTKDIEAEFDKVTPNVPLILSNRGYQLMLKRSELRKNDVTAEDVAAFVRDYRIADNITETNKVLPRFEGRTDERLYLTALTGAELKAALSCSRERHHDHGHDHDV